MADNNPPNDKAPGEPPVRLRHLANATPRQAYRPGYSNFVRRLRIVVPVAGVVVLGILALYPRIIAQLNKPTTITQEDRRARMVNTRYTGTDARGRPFTITADETKQATNGGPIDMVNPVAELTLANGRWVAVKAESGHYEQAAGWIDLTGKVELFHDGGYRFATERAHVEFQNNLVWGDRAVEGHGPKGEVRARGFRVADDGNTIVFTGPARLLMRPKAAHVPEPGEKAEAPDAGAGSDAPPLVVTASDAIEWLQTEKAYAARGHVVAKRGAVMLSGDKMAAYYRDQTTPGGDTEIWRVVAEGAVSVASDGRTASGDRLDYDADKRAVVITGKALKATTPGQTITARDSLEYWQDGGVALARGDAQVVSKDRTLTGDSVMAHFAEDGGNQSSLRNVDASGHVVMQSGTDVIRGERGTYDMESQHAVVSGNVTATRGASVLSGETADFDQAKGVSRMFAGSGKRARGFFVPENGEDAPKTGQQVQPLEVTADRDLEWLEQDRAYVARGNAVATRGTVTLTGDSLIGYYRPKGTGAPSRTQSGQVGLDSGSTEIWRVVAKGNVRIASQGRNATGGQMDYDADARTIVLTGNGLKAVSGTDTITARDSLEYWQDRDLGVARGNALVTQTNGKSLAGDAIGAHFGKGAQGQTEFDTMRASGNVTIVTKTDIVHGNEGTYDAASERAIVTGNVRATRGECQLNGETAEINQATGLSQIRQGAGKRVRGLYVSNKCQNEPEARPGTAGGS